MQRNGGCGPGGESGRYRADRRVAERILAGDPAAFACFYAFYFPRVYAFAARQAPDRDAAERLAGRLLEEAVARLPGYRGRVPLSQWVFGLCVRLTLPGSAASAA